jgi:hypothetical protein
MKAITCWKLSGREFRRQNSSMLLATSAADGQNREAWPKRGPPDMFLAYQTICWGHVTDKNLSLCKSPTLMDDIQDLSKMVGYRHWAIAHNVRRAALVEVGHGLPGDALWIASNNGPNTSVVVAHLACMMLVDALMPRVDVLQRQRHSDRRTRG